MSGRGRGRPKKTSDQSKVKNPGLARRHTDIDDRTESSSSSSDESLDNIHQDEVEQMDVELEQGQLLQEEVVVQEDNALRQMSELLLQIQRNQLATQNKVSELYREPWLSGNTLAW